VILKVIAFEFSKSLKIYKYLPILKMLIITNKKQKH